jgi:MFS family permease
MTAAIAQQQEAALRPLKWTALIGYALGDFGCNLAFTLGSTFLLYYYTDVAGLTAATVGTMFFVVRLWDAFADLIAGRAVDRTMTRWGKFRPFILFFAVPLLFLSFLTFHVPTGLGDAATLLYVYLTYAVLGLLYSLVNIPYGSLASAMTQSVRQRAKLISGRTLGAAGGSVLISYIIAPQISALRAQKNTLPPDVYLDQAQSIFTNITLLFILLGSIAFGLTFLWCHETVVRRSPRVTVKETFATLRQNRPLAILCGASFFYLVGFYTVTGATLYYATYILGDAALAFQVALLSTGVQILVTPFIPKLIGRFGKKTLPGHQGHRVLADQHPDVRAGARHRRVRRVEDRHPVRGCHLRDLLLHPQAHPVDRRRRDGVGAGARWLRLGVGRRRHPRAARVRADRDQGGLRAGPGGRRGARHDRVHHLPADRPALPRGPRRVRGPHDSARARRARRQGRDLIHDGYRGAPRCGPCPASPTRSTPT